MKRLLFLVPVLFILLGAVPSKSVHPLPDPLTDEVSYTMDVIPILEEKCNMRFCHGERGVPKFDTYRVIRIKAKKIADRITDKRNPMPPEDSGITMEPYEIEILKKWVDQGALQN